MKVQLTDHAALTTDDPASSHGIPVLQLTLTDDTKVFLHPEDLFPGYFFTAGFVVHQWLQTAQTTPDQELMCQTFVRNWRLLCRDGQCG